MHPGEREKESLQVGVFASVGNLQAWLPFENVYVKLQWTIRRTNFRDKIVVIKWCIKNCTFDWLICQ